MNKHCLPWIPSPELALISKYTFVLIVVPFKALYVMTFNILKEVGKKSKRLPKIYGHWFYVTNRPDILENCLPKRIFVTVKHNFTDSSCFEILGNFEQQGSVNGFILFLEPPEETEWDIRHLETETRLLDTGTITLEIWSIMYGL